MFGSHIYSIPGSVAVGTNKTIAALEGLTTRFGWIFELLIGSEAAPAEVTTVFALQRFGAVGTSTAVAAAAAKSNPLSPDAAFTRSINHSVEPTYSATANDYLERFGMHQRQLFRYICNPGGEFWTQLVNPSGIGLKSLSSGGTPITACTLKYRE